MREKKIFFLLTALMMIVFIFTGCVPPWVPIAQNIKNETYNSSADIKLIDGITTHNMEQVKQAVSEGAATGSIIFSPVSGLKEKMSPVILAYEYSFEEAMEYLLQQGVNPNTSYIEDYTILMWLSGAHYEYYEDNKDLTLPTFPTVYNLEISGREKIEFHYLEILLKHGASINQITEKGYSALDYSVRFGSPKLTALLLEQGAEITDNTIACMVEQIEKGKCQYALYRKLLSCYEEKTSANINEMLKAAILGNGEQLQDLLREHTIEEKYKIPVLFFTAAYGDVPTLQLLLEQENDISKIDGAGNTLFTVAKHSENVELADYIEKEGM